MHWVPLTPAVLHPDRSNSFNLLQPPNTPFKPYPVTFAVSKLETSRLVSAEQPQNMSFILVTLEVSKLVRSRLVSPEQA